MQAFILAAGLGTRLKPLTESKPKALVEINGKPMIYWLLRKFEKEGITKVVVNVHHFSEQLISYVENFKTNLEIFISHEVPELLDTGGGLKKAMVFFDCSKPVLIHNVDILSDISIRELFSYHSNHRNDASLVVKDRPTSRYLKLDEDMRLCGWVNKKTDQHIDSFKGVVTKRYAFSGVHVINPQLINKINKLGKFPIIPEYLELTKCQQIKGFLHLGKWFDLGTPKKINEAQCSSLFGNYA